MKRIFSAALLTVVAAASLLAHGNMEHVLGTVTGITPHSISVKTTSGTIQVVLSTMKRILLRVIPLRL